MFHRATMHFLNNIQNLKVLNLQISQLSFFQCIVWNLLCPPLIYKNILPNTAYVACWVFDCLCQKAVTMKMKIFLTALWIGLTIQKLTDKLVSYIYTYLRVLIFYWHTEYTICFIPSFFINFTIKPRIL